MVALIRIYTENPNGFEAAFNSTGIDIVEFGLQIGWLQHHRGQIDPVRPAFVWTEKARKNISHLR